MIFSVPANITAKTAAKLIISGEMDLDTQWSFQTTQQVLNEVLNLSMDELLQIVDQHNWGTQADVRYVPQFNNFDTFLKVPECFSKMEQNCIDFAQLGFCLKNDPTATLSSNYKFGDNYGKPVCTIGLTNLTTGHINYSPITEFFCSLDEVTKRKLAIRLFFRMPVIQMLLKEAATGTYNGYLPIEHLTCSTRKRRAASIRNILLWMHEEKSKALDERINRIFWEEIGCDQDE